MIRRGILRFLLGASTMMVILGSLLAALAWLYGGP